MLYQLSYSPMNGNFGDVMEKGSSSSFICASLRETGN